MNVLWLTNVPSPYRVEFFCEMGKFCELTVLFEMSTSTERDISWRNYNFVNFNGIIMKGKKVDVDKAICFQVFQYLNKRYNFIIISDLATPTGIMAIEYMKIHKIPFILEGDGGFAKCSKGFKESYKKHLIQGAKAYFSTSKSHDLYWIRYGAEKDKIYRYPFSSLRENDICSEYIDKEKKQTIKNELGITAENVILSVGRFIYGKGYDVLIKAFKYINNAEIYIIGGNPTTEYLNLLEDLELSNVHFIEFKLKEDLIKYYFASDLFVLPTRGDCWGLVINEAMAYGLPVITTDKCVAGLELIVDYENGFIIPVEDENTLAERANLIISNHDLKEKIANNNLNKIKEYTIESMAKKHIEVLNELIV